MNVIGPFPLYAILNPIYSQILYVRSIWNSFKIFTMSLSAEEFANETLKLILSKTFVLPLKPFRIPQKQLSIHPRSHTISTSQYMDDTCQANEKGQGHVRPNSSGEQFFTAAINTPPLPHFSFTPLDLTPVRASSSSPVRKSFTASTSSPSYSRRPRISSLRRRRSRLPLPS